MGQAARFLLRAWRQATVAVDAGGTLLLRGLMQGDLSNPTTLDPGATGTLVMTGADVRSLDLAGGANILLAGALSTIDAGTMLGNGIAIGKNQTLAFAGAITNPGTIAMTGPGATMEIDSAVGPVQFSGGGTISLPDAADRITGDSDTASLEDIDNAIIGIGSIDNLGTLNVDAGASIVASGGTLTLDVTTINNAGSLGALPGSVLDIVGKLNNSGSLGGLIEIGGAGAGLVDGTVQAGSTILVSAPGAAFDSIVNNGKIVVGPDATLTLTGITDNTGIIDLNGSGPGHHATALIGGMLEGGGTVVFDTGDTVNSDGATQFVNVDNIIEGSGNLGTGGFNFVNHGMVNANVAGNPLLVDPAAPTVQNLSVMEASGGGTLQVVGDLIDTDIIDGEFVDSGIGTLLADGAGSVVALLGGSVTEGLLDSTNGGSVQVQADETLLLGGQIIILPGEQPPYARDSAFTNFADLQVLSGQTLTLASDGDRPDPFMHNYASISLLGSSGDGATLAIDATTLEMDGGGTLSLNSDTDRIVGASATDILINDDTISGFGLLGDGQLTVVNNGWIVADDATRPMIVNTVGTLTNNNTLAIGTTDGGGMVLEGHVTGGELTNAGGTGAFILGGADGAVTLHGGVIDKNTRLVTSATNSTIDASGNNEADQTENFGTIAIAPDQNLTMLGQVTNAGLFFDSSVHIEGDIELQASIDPGSVHHGATLHVGAPMLDLMGFAGQVQLDDASDVIDGAAGTTLISDANTISGSGQIGTGQLNFVNLSFDSVVDATGTLVINGPTVTNNGTMQVSPGGELDIAGAVAGSGVMSVDSGVLTLAGAVAAGQTIEFATGFINPETLALADPLAMAGSVKSLFGAVGEFDTIDLLHTQATSVNSDGHTLTVMNGGDIVASLLLESSFHYKLLPDNGDGNFVVVACFAAGTRILTASGEVAVEALRLGDPVVTLHGGRVSPIKWLGFRHLDCRRHLNPRAVWPIRVRAGAFGPAMPHADLLLSPDHAIYVDGALIPIRHLVKGQSIAQEPRDEVTYWHVELPRHDVLLAEGLPAESYLDTGNRHAFAETAGVTQLHPDFAAQLWEAEACAPLLVTGDKLRAVSERFAITDDATQVRLTGIS